MTLVHIFGCFIFGDFGKFLDVFVVHSSSSSTSLSDLNQHENKNRQGILSLTSESVITTTAS